MNFTTIFLQFEKPHTLRCVCKRIDNSFVPRVGARWVMQGEHLVLWVPVSSTANWGCGATPGVIRKVKMSCGEARWGWEGAPHISQVSWEIKPCMFYFGSSSTMPALDCTEKMPSTLVAIKRKLGASLVAQLVRNLPADAGRCGFAPGPEGSHVLRSN